MFDKIFSSPGNKILKFAKGYWIVSLILVGAAILFGTIAVVADGEPIYILAVLIGALVEVVLSYLFVLMLVSYAHIVKNSDTVSDIKCYEFYLKIKEDPLAQEELKYSENIASILGRYL